MMALLVCRLRKSYATTAPLIYCLRVIIVEGCLYPCSFQSPTLLNPHLTLPPPACCSQTTLIWSPTSSPPLESQTLSELSSCPWTRLDSSAQPTRNYMCLPTQRIELALTYYNPFVYIILCGQLCTYKHVSNEVGFVAITTHCVSLYEWSMQHNNIVFHMTRMRTMLEFASYFAS